MDAEKDWSISGDLTWGGEHRIRRRPQGDPSACLWALNTWFFGPLAWASEELKRSDFMEGVSLTGGCKETAKVILVWFSTSKA